MNDLSAQELRQRLVECTITAGNIHSPEEKLAFFGEYIRRAQPDLHIDNLQISDTPAARNSVSALGDLTRGEETQRIFVKIHIEAGQIAGADGDNEYKGSKMLAEAGWPIRQPLFESANQEYPLLVYEAFERDEKKLFDVIEASYGGDRSELQSLLPAVNALHATVGQAQVASARAEGSIEPSRQAPLQRFFNRRLVPGDRVDTFFNGRLFALPGLERPIAWDELKTKTWVINNQPYDVTLEQVAEAARRELHFVDQDSRTSYLVIAHGDDHPGNIITGSVIDSGKVFDPAEAGWAPGSMANAKALAHSGLLPMSGMYYDPRVQAKYKVNGDSVVVDYAFELTPVFEEHEILARQVIDQRIIPVFQAMKTAGADIGQEIKTLKSALAMCPFFTVDTAKDLKDPEKVNMGIMLMPATVMLSQLRGLPSIEYLGEQLERL